MTQTRIPKGSKRKHNEPETRQDDTAEAAAEQARQKLRAERDQLLDSVLDEPAEPAGATEVLGARTERPELRDRAQANEEYVKTFKQVGGQ